MNMHALTYPSLQRRLITQRRSRALFLGVTTQHVKTRKLIVTEIARAAVALAALAAWCASLLLIAG
jgi:hypothetical protein